jgi:hypothetical protein
MMEAVRTSETLVNVYQTTRCYNPEDSHLHFTFCRSKNTHLVCYSVCDFAEGKPFLCIEFSELHKSLSTVSKDYSFNYYTENG